MTSACNPKARLLSEDDALAPISALQHYLFCPRQCALIHCEREWAENRFTAEGRLLHQKADSGKRESRKDVRLETGVLLRSFALGLVGKADVVEYHRKGGVWHPFPVEYKRGRSKKGDADRVQLCAQALCLEEMHGLEVPEGALFYGATRRREAVLFTPELRDKTRAAAQGVAGLFSTTVLPAAEHDARCASCSLEAICGPKLRRIDVAAYMQGLRSDA